MLSLIISAILLCLLSWKWASQITEHEFEPVESEVSIPYDFQESDGEIIQSNNDFENFIKQIVSNV